MNSDLEQAIESLYNTARRRINELEHQLATQHRYIAELEEQLEPSVVEEIREELNASE